MSALKDLQSNQLVALCLQSRTPECWEEFVRRFQPAIALAVLRAARSWGVTSPARTEDLVQDVFLRLCADDFRLLRAFVPREPDSIVGYLRIIAGNAARDQLRSQNTLKRGKQALVTDDASRVEMLPAQGGRRVPESEWTVQLREIEETLQSFVPRVLTERDRRIFWLYFRQGFTARDISAISSLGLTVKGVESSIHRTTRELRAALNRRPQTDFKGFSGPLAIFKEDR